MGHLGVVLYEYLGEEYPEVLGSILGALKAIVNVIGTSPFFCFVVIVIFRSEIFSGGFLFQCDVSLLLQECTR